MTKITKPASLRAAPVFLRAWDANKLWPKALASELLSGRLRGARCPWATEGQRLLFFLVHY